MKFILVVLVFAALNAKITWGKLGVDTPKYVVESAYKRGLKDGCNALLQELLGTLYTDEQIAEACDSFVRHKTVQ